MAAFCMAVYFRGLLGAETFALTEAMVRSGETIDLARALGRRVVDKHSTGGVGDKTSLAVGPIVAACGVPFGKMSGRGLGHTGGTLDKLESIPGFRVELTTDEFVAQVRGGRHRDRRPDRRSRPRRQEALRAARRHRDGRPALADRGSIMSKKIAAGADAIVLDVKVGERRLHEDARRRAPARRDDARPRRAGRPRGRLPAHRHGPAARRAVGNALEMREAIATLRGEGPPDFTELVLDACARLLALSDLGIDASEGTRRAEAAVADGAAEAAWSAGSGPRAGPRRGGARRRPRSSARSTAPRAGRRPARRDPGRPRGAPPRRGPPDEGATRSTTRSASCAGASAATRVEEGEVLAEVHARDEARPPARPAEVLAAYEIGDDAGRARSLLLEVIALAVDAARLACPRARAARGRDRPARLAPCSTGGASSGSRSRTRG